MDFLHTFRNIAQVSKFSLEELYTGLQLKEENVLIKEVFMGLLKILLNHVLGREGD